MSKAVVYLTFDDGPGAGTRNVVDVLGEEEVRGTLFMIGDNARGFHGTLIGSKAEPFVQVGNHSETHARDPRTGKQRAHAFYAGDQSARINAEFEHASEDLRRFGGDHNLGRLPGRNTWRVHGLSRDDQASCDTREEADSLAAKKFKIFGWDIEWKRATTDSHVKIKHTITQALEGGNTLVSRKLIVLMHDRMFATDAHKTELRSLIRGLKRAEYTLDFVSNY